MPLHFWYFLLICNCKRRDFLAHGQIPLLDLGIHRKVCTILVRNANCQICAFSLMLLGWKTRKSWHNWDSPSSVMYLWKKKGCRALVYIIYDHFFCNCITDEKIKLWLFLPGRHSSVAETAQAAVSRLRGIKCFWVFSGVLMSFSIILFVLLFGG